jgi:hypothetical protein
MPLRVRYPAGHPLPQREHEGRLSARCTLDDGRRWAVWTGARAEQLAGQRATIVFHASTPMAPFASEGFKDR